MIQRRGDFGEPRENFTRPWRDYKLGFGDINGEFWWGNDFLHQVDTYRDNCVKQAIGSAKFSQSRRKAPTRAITKAVKKDTIKTLW